MSIDRWSAFSKFVLTDINFWMELHKTFGTFEQGKELTKQFLHTDYNRLVKEVVERLWKGKDATPYYDLVNSLIYIPGVDKVFTYVHQKGYTTALISASSIDVARRVQQDYGVDYIFANELVIRSGKVTGEFVWPIGVGGQTKADVITQLCEKIGVSLQNVIFIGDTKKDVEACITVGTSIAFNAQDKLLRDVATHCVDAESLEAIIPFL